MAVPWRSLVEGDEQGPSGELWLWNTKKSTIDTAYTAIFQTFLYIGPISGQSYKHFTSVNYDPRVVISAIF